MYYIAWILYFSFAQKRSFTLFSPSVRNPFDTVFYLRTRFWERLNWYSKISELFGWTRPWADGVCLACLLIEARGVRCTMRRGSAQSAPVQTEIVLALLLVIPRWHRSSPMRHWAAVRYRQEMGTQCKVGGGLLRIHLWCITSFYMESATPSEVQLLYK